MTGLLGAVGVDATWLAVVFAGVGLLVLLVAAPMLCGLRWIPNHRVGIVEKLWSSRGSIPEGHLIALQGEAGYQADLLRGGLHFGYWIWQYRIHRIPLTVVPQGKIGYVFARDGEPLRPEQTLGRIVPCNNYQNAHEFLQGGGTQKHPIGQRGRQRAILREGAYAINLAMFVVITQDRVFRLERACAQEVQTMDSWRQLLQACGGFDPVVVGAKRLAIVDEPNSAGEDEIGIVTVHDGPSLSPGQIIAPPVATDPDEPNYHSNYQDIEAFLRAGGRRGRQFVPLTDGTYFINRWFATVELTPKTVVSIGHVGVVVSYYGKEGDDLSGIGFRHGERVAEGARGVQARTLSPGKYAFNTYAGCVHLVPTTNFVLHWITGRSESHKYDESLKSIDLVTADAYEPMLPLSVVVHIDYQKAASVVQRFGDVKKLITQTLDPMLSAYFRDIAHKKTMLELLHHRDLIQQEARAELKRRFAEFDIELVDVLIGKPDTAEASGEIETLLEQLRLRQLSREQIETYKQQGAAMERLKELKMVQALAERQTDLTASQVAIEIAENQGEADLVRGRKRAAQLVVDAEAENRRCLLAAEADSKAMVLKGEAENKRCLLMADAESKAMVLKGEAEGRRLAMEGEAQARVLEQKIASYGDPRLYALSLVAQYVSQSRQPLVPGQLFVTGGHDGKHSAHEQGMLGTLLTLLVADKAGFNGESRPSQETQPAVPPAVAKRSENLRSET